MKILQVAVMAGLTLVSGAAMAQTFGPPQVQIEVGPPPVAPGPGYVLVPGRWSWNGARYVWVGRHWIAGRPGYTHWVPGHWGAGRFGRWHYIEGHWAR